MISLLHWLAKVQIMLMPGQEVEITAGVGAYSKAAQPQITINGANAAIDADGRAVIKFSKWWRCKICTGKCYLYKT